MSGANHHGSRLTLIERDAVAWVQLLAAGEATSADAAAFATWRAQSPAHAAAFAEAERVWGRTATVGRALQDPGVDYRAELDTLARRGRTIHRRAMLGGGLAVVAAAAAYGVTDPPWRMWPSLSELRADYRTGTGEQRAVTVAGDVAVDLNTQSSVAVRAAGDAEDRIELIAGEASFATKSARRSLVVIAADGMTVTDGGRFDVRHMQAGSDAPVSVTCLEGLVRIEHRAGVAALRPGQRVRYDTADLGQIVAVDLGAASDWHRGIVEFRATPLTEAVEEINRYRPGRIVLMNAALGQRQLSGRFRIDQMDKVLLQLEHAFNARLQRLPGGIVLLS